MRYVRDTVLSTLPINEDGKIDGFQFGGRARAIAEWRERGEEKEYRKLFRRIYMNTYMRRRWITNPAYKAWAISRNREWKLKHACPIRTCLECGATWRNVPGSVKGGRPPTKYCSKLHRVRFKNRELSVKRRETGFWGTPEARAKNTKWRQSRKVKV